MKQLQNLNQEIWLRIEVSSSPPMLISEIITTLRQVGLHEEWPPLSSRRRPVEGELEAHTCKQCRHGCHPAQSQNRRQCEQLSWFWTSPRDFQQIISILTSIRTYSFKEKHIISFVAAASALPPTDKSFIAPSSPSESKSLREAQKSEIPKTTPDKTPRRFRPQFPGASSRQFMAIGKPRRRQ